MAEVIVDRTARLTTDSAIQKADQSLDARGT